MSKFIQLPPQLKLIKGKDKQEIILTYTLLRSKIVNKDRTVRYTEEHIAEKLGFGLSSVERYIRTLKSTPGIFDIDTEPYTNKFPHNRYSFPYLRAFTMVSPAILDDPNISSRLKGTLILMKFNCQLGTNFIAHCGRSDKLAALLGVGKNQIKDIITELESKDYIEYIGDSLFIKCNYFPLYENPDSTKSQIYTIITDYCISQKVLPPYKGNSRAFLLLYEACVNAYYWCVNNDKVFNLRSLLQIRCPKLPKDVSPEYLLKALFNIDSQDAKDDRKDKVCNSCLIL